jgi:hypothetical protein
MNLSVIRTPVTALLGLLLGSAPKQVLVPEGRPSRMMASVNLWTVLILITLSYSINVAWGGQLPPGDIVEAEVQPHARKLSRAGAVPYHAFTSVKQMQYVRE